MKLKIKIWPYVLLFFATVLAVLAVSYLFSAYFPVASVTDPTITQPSIPLQTTAPTTEPTLAAGYEDEQIVTLGQEVPNIGATKAFVYDCATREFLYMKNNAYTKLYPASITKLMTAYVALQYLSPDTLITIDEELFSVIVFDSSVTGLVPGDETTVESLLYAAIMTSGSDATHALAMAAGKAIAQDTDLGVFGAVSVFLEEMNRQAEEMGMVNTHFTNCDGYPNYYHYSCMADLALLAEKCLENPLILKVMSTHITYIPFTDGRTMYLSNGNWMLHSNYIYYREECVGMKNGTTDQAGYCILSAFRRGDSFVVLGVFQCNSIEDRLEQTLRLYDTVVLGKAPEIE